MLQKNMIFLIMAWFNRLLSFSNLCSDVKKSQKICIVWRCIASRLFSAEIGHRGPWWVIQQIKHAIFLMRRQTMQIFWDLLRFFECFNEGNWRRHKICSKIVKTLIFDNFFSIFSKKNEKIEKIDFFFVFFSWEMTEKWLFGVDKKSVTLSKVVVLEEQCSTSCDSLPLRKKHNFE